MSYRSLKMLLVILWLTTVVLAGGVTYLGYNLYRNDRDVRQAKAEDQRYYRGVEPRSGQWPTVRKHYLDAHGECAACGDKKDLEVHHVKDFRLYPSKELDEGNLITLCREHHLVFGHLGDFKSFNPCVVQDCARYRAEHDARPYTYKDVKRFEQQFQTAL